MQHYEYDKWVQLFTRLEVSNAHNMYSAKNTIYMLHTKWVQLFTRLEVSNAHNMYSAKNTIYMLHTEDIQHQHANVNPFTNVTN